MIGAWSSLTVWSIVSSQRPCEIESYVIPPVAEIDVKVATMSLKYIGYANGRMKC